MHPMSNTNHRHTLKAYHQHLYTIRRIIRLYSIACKFYHIMIMIYYSINKSGISSALQSTLFSSRCKVLIIDIFIIRIGLICTEDSWRRERESRTHFQSCGECLRGFNSFRINQCLRRD